MARKKTTTVPEVDVQYKTLEELTDGEFLKGADRLSFPFYLDYLTAPIDPNVSIDGYLSDMQIGILAKNAQTRLTPTKKPVEEPIELVKVSDSGKKFIAKRVGILVVIVVLSLVLMLLAVLGVASPAIAEYIGVFKDGKTNVTMLDPILGLVDSLAKTDLTANYPYYSTARSSLESIPVYVTSCALIVFLVCVLVIFVKSLWALFEGPMADGYYKKRAFGVWAIIACLAALLIFISALYVTGGDIKGILSFLNPLGKGATAAFGVYGMMLISLVIAILSGSAYKEGIIQL